MGRKSKKAKKAKALQQKQDAVPVPVPVPVPTTPAPSAANVSAQYSLGSRDDMTSPSGISEKEIKKGNKKFALSLLRQAGGSGWEGHELGKLACLLSGAMELKKEKFVKFLVKSGVLTTDVIAGLQDQGFDFGSSSLILGILFEHSQSNREFLKMYSDALDNSIISVKDMGLILKLADITQRNQFSRDDVVYLLRVSCSQTETLKDCGQLLHTFCMDLTEGQALHYITTVMMLDIVLDLYGLLEDFFNELGDLRSVVEKPIREILKVNRIGEIVDSDADEEGNLKGFVVDDNDSPIISKKRGSKSNGKAGKKQIIDLRCDEDCDDEGDYDEDDEEEEDFDDDEAMEGILSDEDDGEEEFEGEDDDGGVYINQRTWSPSSESETGEYDDEKDPLHLPPRKGGDSRTDYVSDSSEEDNCLIQMSSSSQNSKRKRVINEDSDGDSDNE